MAPPSTPDRYPPSAAFDERIEIKVGDADGRTFFMHKGVLSFYSGYFSAALARDRWVEGMRGVVDLEEEEVAVFDLFQYWAYTRRFCDPTSLTELDLVKLWTLGDRRSIPLLQNEVIDLMKRKVMDLWQLPLDIQTIYSLTPPDSAIRRFVIDLWGNTNSAKSMDKKLLEENWNKEALIDLLNVVWKPAKPTWAKDDVAKLYLCQYHVHEEGIKCNV